MSISVENRTQEQTLIISIDGRFDASCHDEFSKSYQHVDSKGTRFEIDLSKTDYIDSSALGMLLVLRERAGGREAKITLKGYNHSIAKILSLSRFEELFDLQRGS